MKFLIEIEPEFDETAEEIKDCIEETALRGNNFFGTVTIIPEE